MASSTKAKVAFGAWLKAELEERQWAARTLARNAGISQPNLSRIINGERAAGLEVCKQIAAGFELPVEQVLRAAGHLPSLEESYERQIALIQDVAKSLSAEELDDLAAYALLVFRRRPRGVAEPQASEIAEPEDTLTQSGISRRKLRQFVIAAEALLKEAD